MKIIDAKPTNKMHGVGRKLTYPFDKLEVNQCIQLDENDNIKSTRNAAYAYAKRHKKKFKTEKDKHGTIRIYRTK